MNSRCGLNLLLGLALCGLLTGCITRVSSSELVQFSPMEIRAIQTRSYDGGDPKAILKTVLNVLQDEGYLIDFGDSELGILHARKSVAGEPVAFAIIPSPAPTSTMEATANVTEYGNQVKVRINFQQSTGYSRAEANTVTEIKDPKHYQEFFAKLERGLFIQKQGL